MAAVLCCLVASVCHALSVTSRSAARKRQCKNARNSCRFAMQKEEVRHSEAVSSMEFRTGWLEEGEMG